MSGVLDRMAKLALGALPTVEPLTAPRYASRSSEPQGSGLGPEMSPSASHLQAEARDAPSPFEQRSTASKRTDNSALRGLDMSQAAPGPRQAQIRESGRAEPLLRPIPGTAATWNADSEHRQSLVPPGTSTSWSSAQEKPEAQPPGTEPQPMSTRAIAPRPSSTLEPDEHATPHSTSASEEDNVDAHGEIDPLPERNNQAVEPGPAARRDRARRQEQPAPPLEQRTEIHISIGSIELRAPRAESEPPAPAFRPRVSLDDFLHRKPEAGA